MTEETRNVTQVFLNYRAADEPFGVAMLDQVLSDKFGSAAVFLASKSIPLGAEWEQEMFKAVDESVALLVVMGRNWLNAKDTAGRRCIEDPADFVHREILAALNRGKQMIPVRLDVCRVKKEDLPEPLRPLALRQDILVRFRSALPDIDRLAMKLRQQIPALGDAGPKKTQPVGKFSVHANRIGAVYNNEGGMHINGDFYAGPRLG